jgi:hypothetical protein
VLAGIVVRREAAVRKETALFPATVSAHRDPAVYLVSALAQEQMRAATRGVLHHWFSTSHPNSSSFRNFLAD